MPFAPGFGFGFRVRGHATTQESGGQQCCPEYDGVEEWRLLQEVLRSATLTGGTTQNWTTTRSDPTVPLAVARYS